MKDFEHNLVRELYSLKEDVRFLLEITLLCLALVVIVTFFGVWFVLTTPEFPYTGYLCIGVGSYGTFKLKKLFRNYLKARKDVGKLFEELKENDFKT